MQPREVRLHYGCLYLKVCMIDQEKFSSVVRIFSLCNLSLLIQLTVCHYISLMDNISPFLSRKFIAYQ